MNEDTQQTPPIAPTPTPEPQAKKKREEGFFSEIVKFTFFALLIVLPIRLWVAQPFIVSGASMEPTFETGQYLIVNQLSYHFENPQRGQIVIFKYPLDTTKYYIKRVIGLPGETVVLNGSSVIIKNKDNPNGFLLNEPYIDPHNESENYSTITLGDNQYFVMGDNRRESSDSRAWGPVPSYDMVGTPFLRLFPFNTIGLLPGYQKEQQ
jgi:signal peptidase I